MVPSRSLQEIYDYAQSEFDHGDLPNALTEAVTGRNGSGNTDPVWNWKFRILEAEIRSWQGDPNKVLALFKSEPPLGLPHDFVVRWKLAEARALYSRNSFPDSQLCINEAQEVAQATAPALLGDVALVQASLFQYERKYREEEVELHKALDIATQTNDTKLRTRVFITFTLLYTTKGLYDQALDRATEALTLSRMSLHASHLEALIALNMGWTYLELGDFNQAIPLFSAAEAAANKSGLNSLRQSALNNLGRIYLNQLDYSAASKQFNLALKMAQDLQDDSSKALCLDNLALASVGLGRLSEAHKFNQDALEIERDRKDHVAELRSLLNAAWIANASKNFDRAAAIVQDLLHDEDMSPSLLWEAEDTLAFSYLGSNQLDQAAMHFKRALDRLQIARSSIQGDENRLAFSSREAVFYTDYIKFLVDRSQREKALQVTELGRARTLEEALRETASKQQSLSVTQTFLKSQHKVVMTYWLGPDQSYLWVLTGSQIGFFALPAKQEIDAKVEEYQKRVSSLTEVDSSDATGQELYRILIEPARKLIPEKSSVVIIPDGSLGKLNFETLIVPALPAHFWIDDVQIEDASSIALLAKPASVQHHAHKLLAIGDPVEVTSDYPKLRHAADEIKAAASHFSDKTIISGPEAIPSAYALSQPKQFDIIHFATHGFASDARPLDSAIILSAGTGSSFKLYARDIIKTPIKADIVIISACYGAGKRTYSAEGLVGLAWAFLRAGAHQVIAGLWNVEDQSTSELMQTFYAEVAEGKSAEVALRDAKLKMLHSAGTHRLPYYWASLQLYTGS
jgi:CHAT domain-containing protein